MARIDDLIKQVNDKPLRQKLQAAMADMKRKQRFGLVFEEHIPETSSLIHFPVTPGATVQRRDNGNKLYQVQSLDARNKATIEPEGGGPIESVSVGDLMVVKRFGDPIFPALTSLGSIKHGPADKPYHAVVNGENFHALQLFVFLYESQVDCIYIDPPYNTGARDWKYNNRYVDDNDAWRHSKWLSMMQKRLALAKRLLNPKNSVLIVTIDEKEYLHLGMLLDRMFTGCNIQMVSSLINPASVARAGSFGRSDEYIFFVMIGAAAPQRVHLDREWVSAKGRTHTGNVRWDLLRRSGPGSARKDSPGCFYPIYVNPVGPVVAKIGDAIPKGKPVPRPPKGCVAVLPMRKNGTEGRWQWTPETIRERMPQGRVRITGSKKKGFVVSILKDGEFAKIERGEFSVTGKRPDGSLIVDDIDAGRVQAVPGTQWRISSHDATQYGSRLLADLLPDRKFPFPKSLYAVEDALRFFVQDKPNALIMDFFGGSGTTTHAVARLNKQDGGRRRSILVTNNEVSADETESLRQKGLRPGDPKWEALGIFEHITRPRLTAAITGKTPDGKPVAGTYKFTDEFPMDEGFAENIEFFRLDYLDPDEVDLGTQFDAILPSLWLAAGGIGPRKQVAKSSGFYIPTDSPYAVLFQEESFRKFRKELDGRKDITHVWIVTDSEDAFAEMRSALPSRLATSMLYRDYLRNFRINTRHNL
jgi:adenine-specific DNA-methyltransferase